jgi:drug/metabolite transporter (DMT)-like permease
MGTDTAALPLAGLDPDTRGMLLGLAGVALFGFTLPFTKLAVAELPPLFVALGRAATAALLAAAFLAASRARLPPRSAMVPLALVALGCVVGFPVLTSYALRDIPATHSAVLVGVSPLATAIFAALLGRERPSAGFWLVALLGSALVSGYAWSSGGGAFQQGDLLVAGAIVLVAIGYAAGGKLARTMKGEDVICWALLLSAPLTVPATLLLGWRGAGALDAAGWPAWAGFAYVSCVSMFLGFFFWYRGMALGGIARVGQTQLTQPFITLLASSLLLGEPMEARNYLFAAAVIGVVAAGRRMQVRR